jgi:hypothetical protein
MNYIVGTLSLEVVGAVASMDISPASQSVAAGRTAAFTVRATDAGVHMHRLDPAIAALQDRIVEALGMARAVVGPKPYKKR